MLLAAPLRIVPPKAVYYFIFTISGFAGLIYESIWSHYLKLFLGHAAYAQTLVLAIFMGGMAAGAWLASNLSTKSRNPILIYASVELIIGILGILFHSSFVSISDRVYYSILPGLESAVLAHTTKWIIAAMMIIPQSILLGMTFPLMTAGIIRRYPEASGKNIATLYFTNSIGAAIGVLTSGFFLIRFFGLPGTIMTAGVINILLGVVVWFLIKLDESPNTQIIAATKTDGFSRSRKVLLIASFITGLASFIYEIGWIRMLSLVLGSSTHAFELMLSAFIAGLAFGGLWIRKRIETIASPIRFSAYIQITMGILAVFTIPLYTQTFDWMSHIMLGLNKSDEGYIGFLLSSHAIAFIIMLPATFCAGTTLPLFTHTLLKTGYGEKSIGHVYAFNTIGSIVGVIFAINIGLPQLGLKHLVGFGGFLDITMGIVLLIVGLGAPSQSRKREIVGSTIASMSVLVIVLTGTTVSPKQLASGPYRGSNASDPKDATVYFHRDGKTASITVYGDKEGTLLIATNGKADASIQYDKTKGPTLDEPTMILAATLPFAYKRDAKNVATIGLGSGLTTDTILALSQIERVDTIEIESGVIEASKHFGKKVERAHNDPRSHIHNEDAKTFFSVNKTQYDIIISEPSNPWVSGNSSLFTVEFYTQIRDYIVEDGLLVQWIHLYESNFDLVVSILKALGRSFPEFAIYEATSFDLIIIARKNGSSDNMSLEGIFKSEFKESLAAAKIFTAADVYYRLIANKAYIQEFLESSEIPANSDYFPYLDLNAHRAFFRKTNAMHFAERTTAVPVFHLLNPEHFARVEQKLTNQGYLKVARDNRTAEKIIETFLDPQYIEFSNLDMLTRNHIITLFAISKVCGRQPYANQWVENLQYYLPFLIANADKKRLRSLWQTPSFKNCYSRGNEKVNTWMDFYKSLVDADASNMATLGERLVDENSTLDPETHVYLITAAILGNRLLEQHAESVRIWRTKKGDALVLENAPFYLKVLIYDALALVKQGK